MLLRSTDSGAPALTGETGALYSALKWALPQLGWTLEFDDAANSRAAFRNSPVNGTGDYLRIADNPADHDGTNAKTANVRSYSSMSDVDTGSDEVGASNWLITKSMTDNATERPWAIVGDATYFVLLIAAGADTHYQEYYFGDIASDKLNDAGAFLTQANNVTNPSNGNTVVPYQKYGDSIQSGFFSQLRFDLELTSTGAGVRYTEETTSANLSASAQAPGAYGTFPEPASGGIRVVDVTVHEFTSDIRGRLKGLMRILNDVVDEYANFETITNQATARGLKDCIIVNRQSRLNSPINEGVLLLDTDHGEW